MKTLNWSLIMCLILLVSACKDDKKSSNELFEPEKISEDSQKMHLDNELEEALYSGYFVKNEKGYDILFFDKFIYLLKTNPTHADTTTYFFLHVIPKNGTAINLDFPPSEYSINQDLSDNYSNVSVYRRELPKVDIAYDINIGQFTADKRLWENYIQVANLNLVDNKYKNEYVKNTNNNRYLKEFESAFNEGYFMKNQEGFDLLLDDHTLYYIKPNGTDSDLKDMFFLHVKYEGKEEIHNLDFKGEGYQINKLLGKKFENFIVVGRKIPDLGKITEIDTGQFDKNTRSWSVLYDIDKLYDDMNFIYNDQYKEVIKSGE